MDKVLAIVGSPRRYGNTDVLMQLCLNAVKKSGLETETVYLHELNLKNCQGCLACVFKGKCALNDDMTGLVEKMLTARGLIVAAPTYIFSPSAIIKTIIDRALIISPYLEELQQQKRYAVTISVAGSPRWNSLGVPILNQLALAYGYSVLDWMDAYSPGPAEVLLQSRNIDKARELGNALASAIHGADSELKNSETGVQCPICKGSVYSLEEGGRVHCAACMNEGMIIREDSGVRIEFSGGDKNFFDLDERQQHVDDWIKPSRDKYMEHREEIKGLLNTYNIRKK